MATQRDAPQPVLSTLAAALDYAKRGIPVFTLTRSKVPFAGSHGHLDATTDATQIVAWMRDSKRRQASIGIPMGAVSGLLVIEDDPRNGGASSLDLLEQRYGALPATYTVRSGSGGYHRYFRHPGVYIKSKANRFGDDYPGVDVKGDGGYVVAPPSIHPNGKRYELVQDIPFADLPQAWLDALVASQPAPPKLPAGAFEGTETYAGDGGKWLEWAVNLKRDGTSDFYGFQLAIQLLANRCEDVDKWLHEYAWAATCDSSDPFTQRDISRWIRSAQNTRIVQRGEPARSRTPRAANPARSIPKPIPEDAPPDNVTPFRRPPDEPPQEPPQEPAQAERFPLTEMGNAERLFSAHGTDIRYSKAFGFCAWDGTRWRADGELAVRRWAKHTIRAMYAEAAELARRASKTEDSVESKELAALSVELMKWARKSETDRMVGAMLSLIRDTCEVDPNIFDAQPMLLNVRNGTIDLRTGQLHEHRREDYLMQRSPTNYDVNAAAPIFERFVRQIMCERDDLVSYLQRALGYTITGDVSEQIWHLLVGEGENGKGTLIEAITAILGEYAGMLEPESITAGGLTRDPNAPSPEMAGLKGKRLVKVTETEEGARIAAARIKRLSGGDELKGRHLRRDEFRFMPTFKLWLYTNHRPQARETTHAFWRRVRYVPFDFNLREHPGAKDKDLLKKLQAEASGILAWLVRGCLAWQRDGLKPPAAVLEATEAYKRDSDLLQMFLDENTETISQGSTSARAVYGRYTVWCENYGERPMSQRRLGEALSERGFQRTHMRTGWVWLNLQLTDSE